jgi:exopolysaccharide biosynthesis polyprenyl glycosylphosphotransferase
MAASESVSESIRAAYRAPLEFSVQAARRRPPSQDALNAWIMMATDLLAVLLALCLASVFRFDLSPAEWVHAHPWLLTGTGFPIHPGYLLFFTATLLIINRRDGLYDPLQAKGSLHEQRKTVQACFATGLLLCGGLFVMHNTTISRGFVAYVIVLTTLFLCVLRALWRWSLYRKYERGVDTRNVLIVGTSHMGNAVRRQIIRSAHLGRVFKGFLEAPDGSSTSESQEFVLGDLKQLTPVVRQYFVDEIIIAERCPTAAVIEVIEIARQLDIEVLVIPGFYDELTPEAPIEYLGNLPVVALHRRNGKVIGNLVKRIADFGLSLFLVVALLPMLLIIALLIKLDSSGPVFYISHRIGKKGRVFPCYKFRTMVVNADELTHTLASLNERDGILFKITKDPRATKIGRILRKFSLDELPQLFNVLGGDMSLVGPRPPLAREVGQYELEHFRRLEVLPGITGLWQVRARQDPSFTRYVALDLAYVENWSFWLDLKILVKTAEVVLRGTGS